MPRGLVLFAGSERCLLSHPDSPHHRWFLRFAFEGVAYQYTSSTLGCPWLPAFLRFLTQSEDELLSHRSVLLSNLECLGFRVNFSKSALSLSQLILFLGTVIELPVTPECALDIQQLVASFKLGVPHPLKVFQRMLGLIASAPSVLQLGLLHMLPF